MAFLSIPNVAIKGISACVPPKVEENRNIPFYTSEEVEKVIESTGVERKHIVSYSDLKIDSPYNSYLNKGLPPTPISNPGIKSIEAALEPEDNDYLYFVATVDGGNNYSKTYDEHLKYVKEYKDERDRLNKEKSN